MVGTLSPGPGLQLGEEEEEEEKAEEAEEEEMKEAGSLLAFFTIAGHCTRASMQLLEGIYSITTQAYIRLRDGCGV